MEEKAIIHTAISTIFNDVRNIIENGLRKAYQNANTVTVLTYWQVGRRIVEEEQQGERRAEYGAQIINLLSAELCKDTLHSAQSEHYQILPLCQVG